MNPLVGVGLTISKKNWLNFPLQQNPILAIMATIRRNMFSNASVSVAFYLYLYNCISLNVGRVRCQMMDRKGQFALCQIIRRLIKHQLESTFRCKFKSKIHKKKLVVIDIWYITQLGFSNLSCSQDKTHFLILCSNIKKNNFVCPSNFLLISIWIFSLSLYFQSLSRFGQNMFLQKFLLTIYQSTAEWEQTNTEHDSVLVEERDKMWSANLPFFGSQRGIHFFATKHC